MNLLRSAMLVIGLLAPLAAFAQDVSLASKVEAASYPPLSRQAGIQGDVRLRSGTNGVTVVSGHPLLAPAAVNNLKDLGKLSDVEIEAVYHFVLVAPVTRVTARVEKRGNGFERLILHAFKMKTERVVEYSECTETPPLKNRVKVTNNRIEVWIYGAVPCLRTSTSQIASR